MSEDIPSREQCIPLLRRAIEKMSHNGDFEFFVESVRERIFGNQEQNVQIPEIREWYRTVYWILSHDPSAPEYIPLGVKDVLPVPTDAHIYDAYKVVNFLHGKYEREKLPDYFQDSQILLKEFSYLREMDEMEIKNFLEHCKNLPELQEFCNVYLRFHGFSSKFHGQIFAFSEHERSTLRELFAQPIKTLLQEKEVADGIAKFVSFDSLTRLQETIQFNSEFEAIAPVFFESFDSFGANVEEDVLFEFFLNKAKMEAREEAEFISIFQSVKPYILKGEIHLANSMQMKTFFNFIEHLLRLDEPVWIHFLSLYKDSLSKIYLALCESLSDTRLQDYHSDLIEFSQALYDVKIPGYEFYPVISDIEQNVLYFFQDERLEFFKVLTEIDKKNFLKGDFTLDSTRVMEVIYLAEDYIYAKKEVQRNGGNEEDYSLNNFFCIWSILMQLCYEVKHIHRHSMKVLLGESWPRFEKALQDFLFLGRQYN